MRILITGGSGVLGRAVAPLAAADGHEVRDPGRAGLDLFDPVAVGRAVRDVDAVLHLATRIQPLDRLDQPEAWRDNDRLRAEASASLVGAALGASVMTYLQPTVTFVYPAGQPATEDTPVGEVPAILRSALAAEQQAARFAAAGRRGVGAAARPAGRARYRPRCAQPGHGRVAGRPRRGHRAAGRARSAQRHLQRLPQRRAGQQPPVPRDRRLAARVVAGVFGCLARRGGLSWRHDGLRSGTRR